MCCFGRNNKKIPDPTFHHPPPKPIMLPASSSDLDDQLSQSFHSLSIKPSPTVSSIVSVPATLTPTKPPTQPLPLPPQNPTGTTPINSPIPLFPLPSPPRCRTCNLPGNHNKVLPTNRNNNAPRPYYVCLHCKSTPALLARNPAKGWITWNDDIGIDVHNPACFCAPGWVARQDKAGRNSKWAGKGFWTCAVGGCGYKSFRQDGLTDEEVRREGLEWWHEGFEPWLL
ncbi:MAG: hypothetical protein Q9169_007861 [Polycauliona sp. 2 TL-2023]